MTDKSRPVDELDDAFAALRARDAEVPDDLMARMVADAADAMPAGEASPARSAKPVARGSIWDVFGGWRGGLALASSAAIGVLIGYSDIGRSGLLTESAFYIADEIGDGIALDSELLGAEG